MAVRAIVTIPNDVLKRRARPVKDFDAELQTLIDDMVETMRDAPGVGLAAPQVGVLRRVIVVEYGDDESTEPVVPVRQPRVQQLLSDAHAYQWRFQSPPFRMVPACGR